MYLQLGVSESSTLPQPAEATAVDGDSSNSIQMDKLKTETEQADDAQVDNEQSDEEQDPEESQQLIQ